MGHRIRVENVEHQIGVECSIHEGNGWWALNPTSIAAIGTPAKCSSKCTGTYVQYERDFVHYTEDYECSCGDRRTAEIRYVWGIYFDIMCDKCWRDGGYEARDRRGYDWSDAGEELEPEEGLSGWGDW